MNSYRLLKEDGTFTGLWGCSACGQIAGDKPYADACCVCPDCGVQTSEKRLRYGYRCDPCHRADRARIDADRMARAEKLDTWDGRVYDGGYGGNNGYHESLDDFVEHITLKFLSDDGETLDTSHWPEFVYIAEPEPFPGVDLSCVIENATSDWSYEDFDEDDLEGVAELRAAVAAFNEANKNVVAYFADETKAVRVPRPTGSEAAR